MFCFECPLALLNRSMESRTALYSAVIDFDFAVRFGFRVGVEEVSYLEFGLMRILQEERVKFDNENEERKRGR
jgi:hypothetical protein